jgi:hypothetical protein
MGGSGNPLRKTPSHTRATLGVHGWAAFIVAACAVIPSGRAQGGGNVPDIRVEAREVLIPTIVGAIGPHGEYLALHLAARDFHVFEDGKEQEINVAALPDLVETRLQAGNLENPERTPRGVWKAFPGKSYSSMITYPYYAISYRPPLSPEGSCHMINIKVDPKDESGHRLTTVDSPENLAVDSARNPIGNKSERNTTEVDRRNLILVYRRQYCNVPHFENDPLYGTPVSKKLESLAAKETKNRAEEEGFYLSAFDHVDESNASRVHVALDFRNFSSQSGIQSFEIALVGTFSRANGDHMTRFSDNTEEGCSFGVGEDSELRQMCEDKRLEFISHYETEVDLPPGDYDLRVAIDYGGALRRAEVPVNVRAPKKRLAVGGIALCRHYSLHDQESSRPQLTQIVAPPMPSATRLVSKGIEFSPAGDTRFKKKDPLAAYFEVYEPLLVSGGGVHVQFEMRVIDAKTGEVKSDIGFRPADEYVNPGKAVIPISQQVAIGELSPGDYRLQVRAMDSSGVTSDWRSTSFTRE